MQNNRRNLLTQGIIALLIQACGNDGPPAEATPAADQAEQQVYEWKMITSWPKNLPALGTSPEYFADIVEQMSGGRMKIRVYGANELVGGLEVFDAVRQGVAEIGHSGAYYWQGKIPATESKPGVLFIAGHAKRDGGKNGVAGILPCQ